MIPSSPVVISEEDCHSGSVGTIHSASGENDAIDPDIMDRTVCRGSCETEIKDVEIPKILMTNLLVTKK